MPSIDVNGTFSRYNFVTFCASATCISPSLFVSNLLFDQRLFEIEITELYHLSVSRRFTYKASTKMQPINFFANITQRCFQSLIFTTWPSVLISTNVPDKIVRFVKQFEILVNWSGIRSNGLPINIISHRSGCTDLIPHFFHLALPYHRLQIVFSWL